jgi:hypothetical protein
MNKFIALLTTKKNTLAKSSRTACNYANNYYGDQMCVAKQSESIQTRTPGDV